MKSISKDPVRTLERLLINNIRSANNIHFVLIGISIIIFSLGLLMVIKSL